MFILPDSQKENKKRWAERLFKKIMGENVPDLVKDTNLQIQETGKFSNK